MAILRSKRTCSTAVAATIAVGNRCIEARVAPDLTKTHLEVLLFKRTGCDKSASSQHKHYPNIKVLTRSHLIGSRSDQCSRHVIAQIEYRSLRRLWLHVTYHSSLKNRYDRNPRSLNA